MPIALPELTKRYYTTGEVAKLFSVTRSTIRYWESKFSLLDAHKFGNGERRFRADQVELIQKIHTLIKEKGFTIQGAEKELAENKSWYREKDKNLRKLKEIRTKLLDLRLQV